MKKRIISFGLALCFLVALAACSAQPAPAASEAPQSDVLSEASASDSLNADPFGRYEEPVVLRMGRITVGNLSLPEGDSLEDNLYTRYIEEKLNIKIEYDWITADYDQKINLSITSGDLPDAFTVNQKQLMQLAEAGLIEDMSAAFNYASPLVKGYYDSYGERAFNGVTQNSQLLALPGLNPAGTQHLLWIRKDWLDELSLDVPTTVDDVMNAAVAIAESRGSDGTVGLLGPTSDSGILVSGAYNFFSFDSLFAAFGSYPRQWIDDGSGKAVYGSIQPETRQALLKISEMYAAGAIDKEFATRNGPDAFGMLDAARAGMFFAPNWGSFALGNAVTNDPNAEWIPVMPPVSGDGGYNAYRQNNHNGYLVVRKGYEHPEAVVKVLNLQYEGIKLQDQVSASFYEGLHVPWSVWPIVLNLDYEDAVLRQTQALNEAIDSGDASGLSAAAQAIYANYEINKAEPRSNPAAWIDAVYQVEANRLISSDEFIYINPIFYGQTAAMETMWPNLTKLEDEMLYQIILGEKGIEAFDEFVEQWLQQGGDEITAEVNAAIAGK
jgi:putative aldouronate transport system substrate-binding protein